MQAWLVQKLMTSSVYIHTYMYVKTGYIKGVIFIDCLFDWLVGENS